jgi:hypothetical protein
MVKRLLAAACTVSAVAALSIAASGAARADTTGNIALAFGSGGWLYQQQPAQFPYNSQALPDAGPADFAQPGADTSGYTAGGVAPFSNNALCGFHGNTSWSVNTDLLLRHDLTLPRGAYQVHVSGTVDNDASIFVNGVNVGVTRSGNCQTNAISMDVPQALVGWDSPNLLAVRAHDYGGATDLDLQVTYTLDQTPPIMSGVPGDISVDATSSGGAVVDWTPPTATDNFDPNPTVTCDHGPGTTYPLGTTTVTCTATDAAGNQSVQSFTVTVTYPWCGVQQPINADGSSVFKLGSTVPVKFCLTGSSAGVTDAVARLAYAKVSDDVAGDYSEATSTSAATTGNLFRYDPTAGQYIFNLATKGLTSGTYLLKIDLGDGVVHTVQISLR